LPYFTYEFVSYEPSGVLISLNSENQILSVFVEDPEVLWLEAELYIYKSNWDFL
jgi:hypothetical protein